MGRVKELNGKIRPVDLFMPVESKLDGGLFITRFERNPSGELYWLNQGTSNLHVLNPNRLILRNRDKRALGIEPYTQIRTAHSVFRLHAEVRAGSLYFDPTLEEVLTQLPEEHLSRVVAFRVEPGEFDEERGIHLAHTTLYEHS